MIPEEKSVPRSGTFLPGSSCTCLTEESPPPIVGVGRFKQKRLPGTIVATKTPDGINHGGQIAEDSPTGAVEAIEVDQGVKEADEKTNGNGCFVKKRPFLFLWSFLTS